jgi:hypothetical protein
MNYIKYYNRRYNLTLRIKIILLLALISTQHACKKLAETPVPPDQIAENIVYTNDATAISALTSLYSAMNASPFQKTSTSIGSVSLNTGLAADEFGVTSSFLTSSFIFPKFMQNDLAQVSATPAAGGEHWAPFYNFVFRCNAAIEGLSSSKADGLTAKVRQQLIGEVKFIRAFCYFYLVNEFGDVPLALSTDPQVNTMLPRVSQKEVYDQMIADLLDAEEKLSSDFLDASLLKTSSERVRPTKWAATAMLARVYLYTGEYSNAEQKATSVISNIGLFQLLPDLNKVFLKNSGEAIWQIQPTETNLNTREGQTFVIPATGPVAGTNGTPVYLSKQLLNSFETNDKRKIYGNWVDTTIYKVSSSPLKYDTIPYPYKYKIAASTGVNSINGLTEYFMVLRLAEQYLIRAEARAQLEDNNGAKADLNAIRNRAGLTNTTAGDKTSLLAVILHERQVELFSEWGHRWFDLKRTGNIDAVMSVVTPLKANGAPWRSFQQFFPVPLKDLEASPNLTQTLGYQ